MWQTLWLSRETWVYQGMAAKSKELFKTLLYQLFTPKAFKHGLILGGDIEWEVYRKKEKRG